MVRIRLRRTGKKKQPSYRVVVADSESPRDGRFIEILGHYNPRNEPPTIEIDADRARYWLSVGAQPSDAAARLLRKIGVLEAGDEEPAAETVSVEDADAEAEDEAAADAEAEDDADAATEDAEADAAEEAEADSTDADAEEAA
jgi:small subunit ribosomal protein S16